MRLLGALCAGAIGRDTGGRGQRAAHEATTGAGAVDGVPKQGQGKC